MRYADPVGHRRATGNPRRSGSPSTIACACRGSRRRVSLAPSGRYRAIPDAYAARTLARASDGDAQRRTRRSARRRYRIGTCAAARVAACAARALADTLELAVRTRNREAVMRLGERFSARQRRQSPASGCAPMKKLLEITLGIVTSIGGFLEVGSLATSAQAGAAFGFQLIWAIVLGTILSDLSGRDVGTARGGEQAATRRRNARSIRLSVLPHSARGNEPSRSARAGIRAGRAQSRAAARDGHFLSVVGAARRIRRMASALEGNVQHRSRRVRRCSG